MIAIAILVLASAGSVHGARRARASGLIRRRLPLDPVNHRTRSTWLDDALAAAAVTTPASTVRRAWVVVGVGGMAAGVVAGGLPLAVLVAIGVVVAPPIGLRTCRGRRDRLVEAGMPFALDSMARSVRSGGSLRQAVEEAADDVPGPLGADLARVARELCDGVALATALDRWSSERPLAGVRLAVAALGLGAETGGASARAIDGVAATLRTNVAIAGEVRALSSQARMSALVMAVAPVGFMVLAAASDGRTASFLLRTPIGLVCLCAGLGLDLVGGLWMHRLTAIVV